jgi:hypothetical protein
MKVLLPEYQVHTSFIVLNNCYGFLFRSKFIFRTTRELEYLFFPECNIRLYDKKL